MRRVACWGTELEGVGMAVDTTDYDDFARAYAVENETGLFTAHYARPAIMGLAGEVAGARILDAGCGSGPLMESLRDRGVAFDRPGSAARAAD